MNGSRGTTARARWLLVLLAALLAGAAVLLWRHTPMSEFAAPDRLADWLGAFRHAAWAPLAVIGAYVIGGLIFFPLTVLIAATAIVFAPVPALALSLAGSLASATVGYGVGAKLLSTTLHAALGPGLRRASAALETRGVIAVVLVRMAPIAPFTLINLAAGSLHVRFHDYLAGTTLGLAPGIVALTAFGHQLRAVWQRPTAANIAAVAAIVLAWLVLSLLLQRAASRWRARRR